MAFFFFIFRLDDDSDYDVDLDVVEEEDFYQPFHFFEVDDEGYYSDDERPSSPTPEHPFPEDWDYELEAQDNFRNLPFDLGEM